METECYSVTLHPSDVRRTLWRVGQEGANLRALSPGDDLWLASVKVYAVIFSLK